MFDKARFEIVGRVGQIKTFDKVLRVSIACNSSYKKDGQWVPQTDWNEITIFNKSTIKYLTENLTKGDYVRVEGRLRQSSFERNGERTYTTELLCEEFSRQPAKRTDVDPSQESAS